MAAKMLFSRLQLHWQSNKFTAIGLCLIVVLFTAGCAPKYNLSYPAKRWQQANDKNLIEKPAGREESLFLDGADMQFFYQLERLGTLTERSQSSRQHLGIGNKQEALNVNNFDEVANSTWFTNRIGRRSMTDQEIANGPRNSTGPSAQGPWTILSAKTQGQTPGFFLKDANGTIFVVKFDPANYPEIASGAELISTSFFYAFGYNVPENFVVQFNPDILTLSPKAKTKDALGNKIPFTEESLHRVLETIPVDSKGQMRALASKLLTGKPIGPIPYRGVRQDDPNDIIPHEHRRELRGYRVFSAFLDHSDSREANTLDMFVKTDAAEKGYVKHYLIDFGNTLGSFGIGTKAKTHIYDYNFSYARVLAATINFGFYQPYWKNLQESAYPAVGLFEADLFRPERWRPVYPNPAFQNMTDRDGFWAAKILARIPISAFASIVAQAEFSDPAATAYMTDTLLKRRNKTLAYWFSRLSPLDDFKLTTASVETQNNFTISFKDLWREAKMPAKDPADYHYRLLTRSGKSLTDWQVGEDELLTVELKNIGKKLKEVVVQVKRVAGQKPNGAIDLVISTADQPKLIGLRRYVEAPN
jgi:hypothetical protein